jgi:hypothetical protein
MDEFKKYLQNHADELDLDEPRPQVWQNIRQEVSGVKKTNVVMLVTRWAAAACVLALAGIGVWFLANDREATTVPKTTVVIKNTTDTPGTENPVTASTESLKVQPEDKKVTDHSPTVFKTNRAVTAKTNPGTSKTDLRMLTEIESSFTQVINLQRARVSTMPMFAETPEYFDDFKVQIRSMEKDEKSIKAEISKRGLNDALLDQLINLYQQKLNILKQLQIEMNKTNNRYKQSRGPVDTAQTYFLNI